MSELHAFKGLIERLCREDHVGLWLIINHVRDTFPEADEADVKEITIGVLGELLERGLIRAGFPARDGRGFKVWTTSVGDTIARIEDAWESLHREPTIGEVVWFTADETVHEGET